MIRFQTKGKLEISQSHFSKEGHTGLPFAPRFRGRSGNAATGHRLCCRLTQFIWALLLVIATSQPGFGEETYEYPELLVTPSASSVLRKEAAREGSRSLFAHWPVQLSALMTLYAGLGAMNDKDEQGVATEDARTAGLGGVAVGSGWLMTTLLFSTVYRPYKSGLDEVKRIKVNSKRERLEFERLSEGSIFAPARLGFRLRLLSFLSNGGVSIAMAGLTKDKNNKFIAGLSTAVSALPFLFPYYWEQVADQHEEYKKKIYGPLAFTSLAFDPQTRRLVPMLNFQLSWN